MNKVGCINRRVFPSRIPLITSLCVAAFAGCARGPGAPKIPLPPERQADVTLASDGWVKVGGGCVAYRQAEIYFRPRGERVEVELDNEFAFFWRDDKPLANYKKEIPANEAAAFFAEVKRLCEGPRPEPWPSTGAATMQVYLPLKSGTVEGRFAEAHDRTDRDPLLERIREFVLTWAPPAAP